MRKRPREEVETGAIPPPQKKSIGNWSKELSRSKRKCQQDKYQEPNTGIGHLIGL